MKGNNLVLIFVLLIMFNCCDNQESFSKESWNTRSDIFYPERKKIVKDLIENHLNEKMCYVDIINLLGDPQTIHNQNASNRLYFEVETKYGSDIDPDWTKYLEIEVNQDSCFTSARVIKLN
jgi:hypothetical protein